MTLLRVVCTRLVLAGTILVSALGSSSAHPPCGLLVDESGRIVFVFGVENRVLRWSPDGGVEVLAEGTHEGSIRFQNPHHVGVDANGRLYTAGDGGRGVWRIDGETPARHYPSADDDPALTFGMGGDPICVRSDGTVCVWMGEQDKSWRLVDIAANGTERVWADGHWGHTDGERGQARAGNLHGSALVPDGDGGVYFTDGGRSVRHADAQGAIATLAGGGEGSDAWGLTGLARAKDGTLFAVDSVRHRIYRVGDGELQPVAGAGESGHRDGPAEDALFDGPSGIACGPDGDLFVSETLWDGKARLYSVRIRRIALGNGSGPIVSTVVHLRQGQAPIDVAVQSRTIDVGGPVHVLEAGPSDAPVVLFLHDAGFGAETWRELGTLQRVAAAGLRVVAVDFPGMGATPASEHSSKLFLRELANHYEWSSFGLVAPSVGGKNALRLLAQEPERLWGLVAIAPVGVRRFERDLEQPEVPTLLLWGETDRIISRTDAQVLLEKLPAARLEIVAEAGHRCYLESTPRFHELLLPFLTASAEAAR